MSYSLTPNLGLYKPMVDADNDMWGDHLNQNADKLDAFLVSAANVLAYGADPTGAEDSTTAFKQAIATGRNVYIPGGSYRIRDQLTTATTGHEIFGDGRGLTTLLIDQTFNPVASAVFSLVGREQFSPTIRDLTITFAQPSDQSVRANYKTLAEGGTSGTGGTGIKYPPAIALTSTNRFKIRNIKVVRAWVGITNVGTNTIGGFFIRDVEMCAFSVGLSLDNVLDFPHVDSYHMWAFDVTSAMQQIWWDGNTFAIKLGANNNYGGLNGSDICCYDSRFTIEGTLSYVSINGLYMDGLNASLEVSGGNQIQIANGYFSGEPQGDNPYTAQCNVLGGNLFLSNMYFQSGGGKQAIFQSGGRLWVQGGEVVGATNNNTVMIQTGGRSYINGVTWALATSSAWTVPAIDVQNGLTQFRNNMFLQPSIGDIGGVVIALDATQNSVGGNFWNGWKFNAPGPLGDYGDSSPNAEYGKQLTMGRTGAGGRVDFRRGSDGAATGWVGMSGASSTQHMDVTNISGSSQVRLNGTAADVFLIAGTEVARIEMAGLTMAIGNVTIPSPGQVVLGTSSIRAGTGAPTGNPAAGSLWMRSDGAAGTRLYVHQGGGTWLPVAGV